MISRVCALSLDLSRKCVFAIRMKMQKSEWNADVDNYYDAALPHLTDARLSKPFFYGQITEVGQVSIQVRTISKPCHRAPRVKFGLIQKQNYMHAFCICQSFQTQRRTIDVPSVIRYSDQRKIKALECSQTGSTQIRWIQPSHLTSVTGVMTTRKKPDTHQGSYALAISVWRPVCTMESILEE